VVSDFLGNRGTPERQLKTTRLITLVFGILQIGIAVTVGSMQIDLSIVQNVLAVAGFSSGILVGVFTLGVATRHVGQVSAMCGMLAGTAVLCYVKFFTPIAWPWLTLIGATITILVGLIAAEIFDRKSNPPESPRE
jgi:Na+/proline symporter